jgi:hypothetical protein
LSVFFQQELEFTQEVCVAQTMSAIVLEVWLPEIVDHAVFELRQDVEVICGFIAPFFVDAVKGQQRRNYRVQPMELIHDTQTAFVDTDALGFPEQMNELVFKWLESIIGILNGPKHNSLTDWLSK